MMCSKMNEKSKFIIIFVIIWPPNVGGLLWLWKRDENRLMKLQHCNLKILYTITNGSDSLQVFHLDLETIYKYLIELLDFRWNE